MKTPDGSVSPLITSARLSADLGELGVRPGDSLMIHSSIRALAGPSMVLGGPIALIEALMEAVGEAGLLVMPAFSSLYSEPSHWRHPPVDPKWWPVVREYMPAFDPRYTPSNHVGLVAECFRTMPTVRRSAHPHASFCAWGRDAERLTAQHSLEDAFGMTSPLGALYDRGAKVLMLGTNYDTCTAFHLAETRMPTPPPRLEQGARIRSGEESQWVRFEDLAWDSDDFETLGPAWEATGGTRRGPVGHGTGRLFSLPDAVDFGAKWLEQHRRR